MAKGDKLKDNYNVVENSDVNTNAYREARDSYLKQIDELKGKFKQLKEELEKLKNADEIEKLQKDINDKQSQLKGLKNDIIRREIYNQFDVKLEDENGKDRTSYARFELLKKCRDWKKQTKEQKRNNEATDYQKAIQNVIDAYKVDKKGLFKLEDDNYKEIEEILKGEVYHAILKNPIRALKIVFSKKESNKVNPETKRFLRNNFIIVGAVAGIMLCSSAGLGGSAISVGQIKEDGIKYSTSIERNIAIIDTIYDSHFKDQKQNNITNSDNKITTTNEDNNENKNESNDPYTKIKEAKTEADKLKEAFKETEGKLNDLNVNVFKAKKNIGEMQEKDEKIETLTKKVKEADDAIRKGNFGTTNSVDNIKIDVKDITSDRDLAEIVTGGVGAVDKVLSCTYERETGKVTILAESISMKGSQTNEIKFTITPKLKIVNSNTILEGMKEASNVTATKYDSTLSSGLEGTNVSMSVGGETVSGKATIRYNVEAMYFENQGKNGTTKVNADAIVMITKEDGTVEYKTVNYNTSISGFVDEVDEKDVESQALTELINKINSLLDQNIELDEGIEI